MGKRHQQGDSWTPPRDEDEEEYWLEDESYNPYECPECGCESEEGHCPLCGKLINTAQ